MSYLSGKTAIVTGGASGIGESTVRELARNGVKVLIADVKDGATVASDVGGIFIEVDVTESAQVEAAVGRAVDEWGRLDIMVNNAGVEIHSMLAETDDAEHRRVIDIDLNGVFYGIKYAVQAMLKNDGEVRGTIVNIASAAGLWAFTRIGSYVAAKHGVVGLTKTTALEYAKDGIRTVAICPGIIRTPLLNTLAPDEQTWREMSAVHPANRVGRPEEVANLIRFLVSDEAPFINGTSIAIDGGLTAGSMALF